MKNIESIAEKYADLIMQDTASKSANVPTPHARVLAAIREAVETEVPRLFNLEYECKAAGFVTAEGEVRKVLGEFEYTDDGYIVAGGATVYFADISQYTGKPIVREWDVPNACSGIPVGSFYSTPEAARAAKENAQ